MARALDRPTVAFDTSFPSFSVYRHRVVPNRQPRPGELVFLRTDRIKRLRQVFPETPIQVLYRRGGVALVDLQGP